jgi:hypothetical protein
MDTGNNMCGGCRLLQLKPFNLGSNGLHVAVHKGHCGLLAAAIATTSFKAAR